MAREAAMQQVQRAALQRSQAGSGMRRSMKSMKKKRKS
jgi:hypothetical protein